MIDPNKRTHREKFQEYVEELLDVILIENLLFELLGGDVKREDLKRIDQDITFLLDKVQKKIEG